MELPDLSHLTAEEQKQILSVIKRQKDEEEKEKAMTRTLKAQFENYKQQIKNASATAAMEAKQSPDGTKETGQVCTLCYKTKIAEGCGHACSYCTLKFCSRCGGRVPVRSNKVMWVCNLCRKQQEMLTKTGAWHKENQSGLTLNLEPLHANEIKKMSGSASMAQLDNKTTKQRDSSSVPKLKKGQSEPQLTQCEKQTEVQVPQIINSTGHENKIKDNVEENIPADFRNKQLKEVTDLSYHDGSASDTSSVATKGVRRSSTHSERRLHRQEQAVGRSEVSPSNKKKQNTPEPKPPVSTARDSSVQNKTPSLTEPRESVTSNITEDSENLHLNSEALSTTLTNIHKDLQSNSVTNVSRNSTSYSSSSPRRDNMTIVDSGLASEMKFNVREIARKDADYHHAKVDAVVQLASSERAGQKLNDLKERNSSKINENWPESLPRNKYSSPYPSSEREVCLQHVHEIHHGRRSQPYPCNQYKHQREYSSDHEGVPFPHDYHTQTSHHRQNNSRNSSVIAFDDVQSCRYCQPSRHCQHGQPPPRSSATARFSSTDNVNLASGRTGNRSMYHSDVDLSKPMRHHSSAETVHSCGHPCRQDHTRRRNYSPRHAVDSLHMATQRKLKSKHVRRKPSVSSTDEEIQSTPDYSSCDEMDKRIDHTREGKINLFKSIESGYHSSSANHSRDKYSKINCCCYKANPKDPHFLFISSPFHNDLTEQTAFEKPSFDIGSSEITPTESEKMTPEATKSPSSAFHAPESVQDNETPFHDSPNKRDSGIDTGSSANTIHGDDLYRDQHPVLWQPSADGRFLIGRMVLNKEAVGAPGNAPSAVLGVKVVGGKETESGYIGAFITRVKKGSVAETVGHLKPGDEVIMWNDYKLRGASFNEVCDVVLASKDENLTSLVVSRPIEDIPRIPGRRQQHPVTESSSSSFDSQKREDEFPSGQKRYHRSYPHLHTDGPAQMSQSKEVLPGKLQVRIFFDQNTQQLYVTVVQAVELQARPGGLMRSPYVKMYLLPDRSVLSKRRTKTVRKTLNPVWDQTFAYSHVRRQDLESLSLELTLWDLDRSQETNSYFLGEVLIDLGLSHMDNTPQWFKLMPTGARMNRISDPAHKQRAASTGLRPVPGSAPVLHIPSSHVSYSASQHDYYSPAVQESLYGPFPPRMSATTSNLRTLGSETLAVPIPPVPHRNVDPVITKESRTVPSEPTLSNSWQSRVPDIHHEKSNEMHRKNSLQRNLPAATSTDQRRSEKSCDSVTQQSSSTKRQRHSSAAASKEGSVFEGKCRQLSDSTNAASTAAKSTGRMSESQISENRNASSVSLPHTSKEEGLSKSASLGANLHEQNEAKSLSPKSKVQSSRSKTSVNDMKSTPPNRRTHAIGQKITTLVGMKSKSSSNNALESDKSKSSPRCVEFGIHPDLQRDGSRDSASGSFPSVASEGSSSIDKTLQSFIGGLGPGQIVGRQTLAASSLGEIELGLFNGRGELEVQVIRARNLVAKTNGKLPPAPYVKVYLVFENKVVCKKKTKIVRRGADPAFNQLIVFEPSHYGNSLQVVIWGDIGRMGSKVFMGLVQIRLEGLDISSDYVYGWYKLYPTSSLTETSVLGGHSIGSMTSLEMEG